MGVRSKVGQASAAYLLIWLLGISLVVAGDTTLQSATEDEAMIVAQAWLDRVVQMTGEWGDHANGLVTDCTELRRGDRVIGYYCTAKPSGFLVVSLYKCLAPVKFYFPKGNISSESEEGLAGFVKDILANVLDGLEVLAGPLDSVSREVATAVLEFDHNELWSDLLQGGGREHGRRRVDVLQEARRCGDSEGGGVGHGPGLRHQPARDPRGGVWDR